MKSKLSILGVVLIGALAMGCSSDPNKGYTITPPYRMQYKSVYVPIAERGKDVYRRRLEFRATEAVKKRIEGYTPYRLADKGHADTELTIGIDDVVQGRLSVNPDTGLPREMQITFITHFKWVDVANGKVLAEKKTFRVSGTYFPTDPLHEDFFQGSEDVIDRLAERIVEQMEVPFTRQKPKP